MNYLEFETELERSPTVAVGEDSYFLWEGLLWRLGDEDEAWLLLLDEMFGDRSVRCQWLDSANSWALSFLIGKDGKGGVVYCTASDPRNFLEALDAETAMLRSVATDLHRVLVLAEAGRQASAQQQLDEAAALISDMDNILGEIE